MIYFIFEIRLTLRGLAIALSNAWGLFLIIVLLGYGLVTVPKHCFKMTDIEAMNDVSMFRVSQSEEKMMHTKLKLEDIV